ncbi:MAG: hypothetical protein EB034_11760 [Verrucomicrobia bacterium]|nr:hypothetical protein [Verrucomicrobiota bacterium]
MKKYIEGNLRNLRPTNPGWVGFTLQDALQGLDHQVATGAEALPDLLRPGPGGSGFVALRWLGTKHPSLEMSPTPGQLVEIPSDSLTPTLLSDLGRLPLLAFNGAEDFSRLAELTGHWPTRSLSLLTMVRVLENGATTADGQPLNLELDAVCQRYGLPHGPQAGNPTPRLHKLRDVLLGRVAQAGLWPTCQLELKLMPITHRMRTRGIRVDAVQLEKVRKDYEARASAAATELRAALGKPSLNPDDSAAVRATLQCLGLSVTGTSKEKLCRHHDHPAVRALQAYRKVQGVHTSARTFLAAVGPDGRIHPCWDPFGAATGRFSCSDPAFQGLSKNRDLRRCFKARDGFVLVACDYAQADLRPLASASQDAAMLAIFQQGLNFHRVTAARLMQRSPESITEAERAVIKIVVFGIAFGMGPERLALEAWLGYGFTWTTEEARRWMDSFYGIYSGLCKWRDAIQREAGTATECRSLFLKRRRFLPTDPGQRGYRSRCLMNMPAQGTVADAIKRAMINIAAKLHPEDAIIANVHDELLLEVRAERAEEVLKIVPFEMEHALADMLTGVPVETEAGIYANWAKEPTDESCTAAINV